MDKRPSLSLGPVAGLTKDDDDYFPTVNWPSAKEKKYFARPLDISMIEPSVKNVKPEDVGRDIQKAFNSLRSFGVRVADFSLILDQEATFEGAFYTTDPEIEARKGYAVIEVIQGENLNELFRLGDKKAIKLSEILIDKLINYYCADHGDLFLGEIFSPRQYVIDAKSGETVLVDIDPLFVSSADLRWQDLEMKDWYKSSKTSALLSLYSWILKCNFSEDHTLVQKFKTLFPHIMKYKQYVGELSGRT